MSAGGEGVIEGDGSAPDGTRPRGTAPSDRDGLPCRSARRLSQRWRPAEWCSRSSWRNPQVAARIAVAGGPVGARRAGTSGDRTTDRSGTYRTAPKRRRRTVIGYTPTRDTTLAASRSLSRVSWPVG
ncbi:hypothetical protein SSP531S_58240 [Streptomyces spongiicola]|uniref:Uncharacterized protein n=1 Tax=Streptomyces spongiicola TaxID=1690221 RepID=A0A388T865_9ACTN|nr:hypothetical protein SSP531S_58240 [Streptomyces spongiicola]